MAIDYAEKHNDKRPGKNGFLVGAVGGIRD